MVLFGDASEANTDKLAYGHCLMATFTNGGTVFSARSTDWAYGLDDGSPIQRVTFNVLSRLAGS